MDFGQSYNSCPELLPSKVPDFRPFLQQHYREIHERLKCITHQGKIICYDCNMTFISEETAQSHFLGRRHWAVMKHKYPCKENFKRRPIGKMKKKWPPPNNMNNVDKNLGEEDVAKSSINVPEEITPIEGNFLCQTKKKKGKKFKSIRKTNVTLWKSISIYRTPSGKYYCQMCNRTLNSKAQFLNHVSSKKHMQKANRTPNKV